ncbi:O-methyltransferase family 3 protein [Abortiporus biennis]|nr:O-methyltransferase family 3 protein [Abortiporus biennis]
MQDNWSRSDFYHNSFLVPQEEIFDNAKKTTDNSGLPTFAAVSTSQGKFLNLIAKSVNAKRILEVGTLGGYSTIWLARALPEDGLLVSTELHQKHADVAKRNLTHAGVSQKVQIVVGPAEETLKNMKPEENELFDLVFIDADTPNDLTYFLEAQRMTRKGGVIIVDNVIQKGVVADPTVIDPNSEGIRKLLRHIKVDPTVEATTISTVGEKGYDGFLYAVVQ